MLYSLLLSLRMGFRIAATKCLHQKFLLSDSSIYRAFWINGTV